MSFIVSNTDCDNKSLQTFESAKTNFSDVKMVGKINPRKTVYVSYDSNEKLHLQTPEMKIPYNITGQSFDGQNTKYDVTLSFNDMTNKKQAQFKETIKQIDQMMMDKVCNNDELSRKWLKQKAPSPEVAKALYNPMLKVHMDKNTGEPSGLYPDSLRIKLPFYKNKNDPEGSFAFDLFDCSTKEIVDKQDILKTMEKGSKIRLLVECTGVYFVGGKYGLSWKAVQASIKKPKVNFQQYSFVDESDDEDVDVRSLDDDE